MADKKQDNRKSAERRDNDRRIAIDSDYSGPERRTGDRRQHERRDS